MLHLNDDNTGVSRVEKKHTEQHKMRDRDYLWQMYFNGSSCKEGARACIVLISLGDEIISLMYKLEFQTTNNTVEYEALILGLRAVKDLNIQQLTIFDNFELIIQ